MTYDVITVNTPDHLREHLKRIGDSGWRIQWMHFCAGQYVVVLYAADGWRSEALKACLTPEQEKLVKALIQSITVGTREGITDDERREEVRALLTPILKNATTAVKAKDVGLSSTGAKTAPNGTAPTPR